MYTTSADQNPAAGLRKRPRAADSEITSSENPSRKRRRSGPPPKSNVYRVVRPRGTPVSPIPLADCFERADLTISPKPTRSSKMSWGERSVMYAMQALMQLGNNHLGPRSFGEIQVTGMERLLTTQDGEMRTAWSGPMNWLFSHQALPTDALGVSALVANLPPMADGNAAFPQVVMRAGAPAGTLLAEVATGAASIGLATATCRALGDGSRKRKLKVMDSALQLGEKVFNRALAPGFFTLVDNAGVPPLPAPPVAPPEGAGPEEQAAYETELASHNAAKDERDALLKKNAQNRKDAAAQAKAKGAQLVVFPSGTTRGIRQVVDRTGALAAFNDVAATSTTDGPLPTEQLVPATAVGLIYDTMSYARPKLLAHVGETFVIPEISEATRAAVALGIQNMQVSLDTLCAQGLVGACLLATGSTNMLEAEAQELVARIAARTPEMKGVDFDVDLLHPETLPVRMTTFYATGRKLGYFDEDGNVSASRLGERVDPDAPPGRITQRPDDVMFNNPLGLSGNRCLQQAEVVPALDRVLREEFARFMANKARAEPSASGAAPHRAHDEDAPQISDCNVM